MLWVRAVPIKVPYSFLARRLIDSWFLRVFRGRASRHKQVAMCSAFAQMTWV